MQISAVGFTPYIYNTNTISALSMNRIAAIPGDVTEQKIDYTGLTSDESENINPLGIGQSANFMDILSSQMSMSRYHQARIMKDMRPMEEEPFDTRENTADDVQEWFKLQETDAEQQQEISWQNPADSREDLFDRSMGNGFTLYQRNRALEAYSMSMIQ